jgi:Holliday junction resolvase-like predicted endonuclease
LYGRRRIGKTFLIREYFSKNLFFSCSGVQNGTNAEQLSAFQTELKLDFLLPNFFAAFFELRKKIEASPSLDKKVIFIDELPWLYTNKCDLIRALEYFWNQFCSARKDILLIVCGSASSWIIDKIVNNIGGLYNRLSLTLHIKPFTLKELEQYFDYRHIELNKLDILNSYMIFGGVPFYYNLFKSNYSLAQNVDYLFFNDSAPLRNEFNHLYSSLFKKYENYVTLIKIIGDKSKGLTREEIIKLSGLSGGQLTIMLNDLKLSGFINEYKNFGNLKKESIFQLIDSFSAFYLSFHDEIDNGVPNFYSSHINTPLLNSWSGYAFERVIFLEIKTVLKALEIGGMSTQIRAFYNQEAQIDLIIDRADNIIELVEVKYYNEEFVVSEEYSEKLRKRMNKFISSTNTKKSTHYLLVSIYGLKRNTYSGIFQNSITLLDLFK